MELWKIRFILRYLFSILFLFSLLYFDISPIAQYINSLQTEFTSHLVSLTLPEESMIGDRIIVSSHYSLVIEKGCNGMLPYLFLLASILSFPSSIKNRVKWAIYSYIVISVVNIFRIWLISNLVFKSRENFFLAHDLVGNLILVVTSLVLFLLFIRGSRGESHI